jgi:putative N6-adenine-specific DNA methylase
MSPHSGIPTLRLIGLQGTNKIMAGELSRLARRTLPGAAVPEPRKAGAASLVYPFSRGLARTAVAYHRTASRVLADLFTSTAARLEPLFDDLVAQMRAHPGGWYRDGTTISIRARAVDAFAAGERQVVGVVKNAVCEGAAARGARVHVDAERPDVELAVRMHEDTLVVSIDLGGPMHRRGYRRHAGPAPIRENLAAALVMLARHDSRREILLDPMAGSGTIAIEAAAMGRGMPLWSDARRPPCARIPGLGDIAAPPLPPLFPDTAPVVIANEIDTRLVAAMRDNADAAGVSRWVSVRHGDFRTLTPAQVAGLARQRGAEPRGVIVCNPPYGERLRDRDVEALYGDLRRWLREFRGWRAAFLVANPEFEPIMGIRPRVKKPLSAAGLRGYFYLYEG